jgi:proton glutamate symport protein
MGRAVKRIGLSGWVFIGMAGGVLAGLLAPGFAGHLAPLSSVFLRLVRSIVAPLLFGTLVSGIFGLGGLKAMGRVALKSIIYFEIVTTLALLAGLAAGNLVRPGEGVALVTSAGQTAALAPPPSAASFLEHVFPTSVIDAMARGEVLQVVVFSLLFGAACAAAGAKAKPVVDFAGSLAEVMFKFTGYVMWLAPAGVFAAAAVTISGGGPEVLLRLGTLVLTTYAALAAFTVLVLGAVILIARISVPRLWMAVRDPVIIAFSTASSEVALPRALENMERYGVPKHIVSFVIPMGCSFNLAGSTLYLPLASLFVAQAAGVELTIAQQILMLLTLMLTSKGVAGVPRASLVILAGTLAQFGLPLEGVAVILGVDALMDMARTAVNVFGNCLAAAVIAKFRGPAEFRGQATQSLNSGP